MKNLVKSTTALSMRDYWRSSDMAYSDACALCGVESFALDVAASRENSKCEIFICESQDALSMSWRNLTIWCNPPFTLKVDFLSKAHEQRRGKVICMMLPYEPCTAWWRNNVDGKATAVYVPDGRYNYCHPETGKEVKGVNFASAFVVFTGLQMNTQYINFQRGIGAELTIKKSEVTHEK